MFIQYHMSWKFTAACRFFQQTKYPQWPWSLWVHVLHPLADYMANVTAREEDEAHWLYQLGQLTKVVSPTFVLTPCSFLAHTGPFSKWKSDLILRFMGQALLISDALPYQLSSVRLWTTQLVTDPEEEAAAFPASLRTSSTGMAKWKEHNPCSSARQHKREASPLCPDQALHIANQQCV